MPKKSVPKDFDIADRFFSGQQPPQPPEEDVTSKESTDNTTDSSESSYTANVITQKNLGGRPKKDGLKNEQFTLTMNPEMYEKLRIIAAEHTRGNFSGLIDEAIKSFCKERNIDLAAVNVDPEILEMYRKKQEKKSKKK